MASRSTSVRGLNDREPSRNTLRGCASATGRRAATTRLSEAPPDAERCGFRRLLECGTHPAGRGTQETSAQTESIEPDDDQKRIGRREAL